MWNFNEVNTVTFQRDYVYRVAFDDGLIGDVDFAGYLDRGPVFAALRDPQVFKAARVENGTITWPNGADIAPERLYELVAAGAQVQRVPLA